MFNSLASMGMVQDALVWDLFAGSGALGIEALSRGASSAVFVERDRRAATTIAENVAALGLTGQATVACADVLSWLASAPSPVTPPVLVLADPPYDFEAWDRLLALLAGLGPDVVACESDRSIEPDQAWRVGKIRRHGGTVVSLLVPRGALKP
jgi:16S rRNA (guanine966-N2)-methyltransferase